VFGLIVALVDVAALYWLDVSLPWLWGLLSFITNYIPNIGFVLALVPPALLALLQGGVGQAVFVVVAYSVINLVIQSLIQPKFVGTVGDADVPVPGLLDLRHRTARSAARCPFSLFAKALLVDADPDSRWLDPLIAPGQQGDGDGPGREDRGET
jgi:AI-2 transport protein TqsA